MEKHLVICIGRQFGSGGREIGLGLAKKLGIRFYDKEILKKAAEESGIVEELFEKADEKPTNSFLYSLSMGTHGQAMNFTNYNDYLTNDKLFLFQSNTIRDMAEKDSCVIIGRCADYILRGRKDMLSVFIHAPMELRIQRISRVRNVEEDVYKRQAQRGGQFLHNRGRRRTEPQPSGRQCAGVRQGAGPRHPVHQFFHAPRIQRIYGMMQKAAGRALCTPGRFALLWRGRPPMARGCFAR